MRSFILIVHIFVTLCMVILILIQQTDKGGFGASGSGDPSGGFFTSRPRATPLSRLTAIFAAGFIGLSLLSAYLAHREHQQTSLLTVLDPHQPSSELNTSTDPQN